MNEKKQKENERKFINWIDTEDGGRKYKKAIIGRFGWFDE